MTRVAINTPTGRIGNRVAELLLEAGAEVMLLTRDANSVASFLKAGAEAWQGSIDDESFVVDYTEGADVLFWLTPMMPDCMDLRSFQSQVGQAATAAVRENGIARVVNVSSFGAHPIENAGVLQGLHDVEELFDATGAKVTHLRAGYFYENFLLQLESIQVARSVFLPISGRTCVPMVDGLDVAEVAVKQILDDPEKKSSRIGVHGPENLSFDQAAEQISEAVGVPIDHVRASENLARKALVSTGFSRDVTEKTLKTYRGIESGELVEESSEGSVVRTTTTLRDFAAENLVTRISMAR